MMMDPSTQRTQLPPHRRPARIFIASPGDALEERATAEQVVRSLSRSSESQGGPSVEPVLWEMDAAPGVGRPQQRVLDHVQLEAVEVFVGIFRSRLGTPTGRAASGTVEEFDLAYSSWEQRSSPEILIYFFEGQQPEHVDRQQLDRLGRFRQSLEGRLLSWTYESTEGFSKLLSRHLDLVVIGPRDLFHDHPTVDANAYKKLCRAAAIAPGLATRALESRLSTEADATRRYWIFLLLGETGSKPALRILENQRDGSFEEPIARRGIEEGLKRWVVRQDLLSPRPDLNHCSDEAP
jgi:hypothetical protein